MAINIDKMNDSDKKVKILDGKTDARISAVLDQKNVLHPGMGTIQSDHYSKNQVGGGSWSNQVIQYLQTRATSPLRKPPVS